MIYLIFFTTFVIFLTFCILHLYNARMRMGKCNKRVFIVVLGDIGRSPRMQYHALSFSKAGFDVCVVGYGGSNPIATVRKNASIHLIHMSPVPSFINRLPKMLAFLLKIIWQSLTLVFCLLFNGRPSHILMQNPPSVPTMIVCYIASVLRGCELVIDWHNYGYTILALGLQLHHPLVKVYKLCEHIFGRLSAANICVTNAMREDLSANWNIKAVTMHDRPPDIFRSIDLQEKHELFKKLDIFKELNSHESEELTKFTVKENDGSVRYREKRAALLVSSTSWTEDEDFSILLRALDIYDEADSKQTNTPTLIVVITGKGPQKDHYMDIIKQRRWKRVTVHTPWLEAEDYPTLLACADLGVCLHKSSSGYDLPMKVVDMFGCGLPVCAVQFPCLNELVRHEENGLVFNSATELGDMLQMLFRKFPGDCIQLEVFRNNLKTFQQLRWDECWTRTVLPIFSKY